MEQWRQQYMLRSQFRGKTSYSVPETVNRSRDFEKFYEENKDEIEQQSQQMAEAAKQQEALTLQRKRESANINIIQQFNNRDGV